ncbi:MAG: hypothetical protein HW421_3521 [Ignavibacteria bacterium]|nr:hypothetical protein [Ignavibacteria bacterium]
MKQIIYIIAALAFIIIYTSCEDSLGLEKKVRITPLFERDTTKPPPPPPPPPPPNIKIHCDSIYVFVTEDMGITGRTTSMHKPKEWERITLFESKAAIIDTSNKLLALWLNFKVYTNISPTINQNDKRYDWVNSFSIKLDSVHVNPDKENLVLPNIYDLNGSATSGHYLGINIFNAKRITDTLVKQLDDCDIALKFAVYQRIQTSNLNGRKFLYGKIRAIFPYTINTYKLMADIWIFYH